MKIKMIIALLVMLVMAGGVSAQSDAELREIIIGNWEHIWQQDGTIGFYEFYEDGTYQGGIRNSKTRFDGTYYIKGGKIFLDNFSPKKYIKSKNAIIFQGNEYIKKD